MLQLGGAVVLSVQDELEHLGGNHSQLLEQLLPDPVYGGLVAAVRELGQLVQGRVELIRIVVRIDQI